MRKEKLRAALLATADWLEQFPERHIATVMAADKQGNQVSIGQGYCFCADGRLAFELGLTNIRNGYSHLDRVLKPLGICSGEIWMINDSKLKEGRRIPNGLLQGNPGVIPVLRELAMRIK